ncbi:MAG: YtxH domain-containing protein [Candidatus Margulisiibacteriota bacterium]
MGDCCGEENSCCSGEKSGNILEGLLLGGLIGGAIGILFAPSAGEKARAEVKDRLKEFHLDEIMSRFSEAFEEGKKEAEKVQKDMGE